MKAEVIVLKQSRFQLKSKVMVGLEKDTSEDIVDLFWSGGWDSTFRLLQLLLDEKKKVQPHYVVWTGDTVGETVEAMQKIRSKLFKDYPATKDLLLPINYIDSLSIKKSPEIETAYKNIGKEIKVGYQHALLAHYCSQHGYDTIEQGIEKNSHSHHLIMDYLTDYRVDKRKSPEPIYELLKYFEFRLVDYEKFEMDEVSIEKGWDEIMNMTWFCRRPKNGKPCGFCGNCTDTLLHGMGKRLPLKARIIAYIQLPFRKWWRNNYKKQNKGVYRYIKKALRHKA